jgi:ribonuclease HI
MTTKQSYYAVHRGHQPGIFNTWVECKQSITKYRGAVFKKFDNLEDAERFVLQGKLSEVNTVDTIDPSFIPNTIVYTDGACINNGKRNARAGIGIYFGQRDSRNVSRRIIGKQTNNTAELTAIIEAYNILQNDIRNGLNILIYSDSTYAIRACTTYGAKLHKLKWNKDVPNLELVKLGYNLFLDKPNIKLAYIKAHTGGKDIHSIGNEHADRLANKSLLN